jgi:uncharacterized membrane protein YdjX (TVP38/TMEM64 family)
MITGLLRAKKFWMFLLAGVLLAVVASNLPLQDWIVLVKDWIVTLGFWAIPGFVLVYLLATILCLPNVLLMLIGGTLFGLGKGIIAVSIADTMGAVACFFIGRTIARKRVKNWMCKNPKFAQLDHAVNQKGWKILLLTRLSPLLPSNLLNYGFSCTKVNFWQYCFFSWLGMLPVIALYVYLGSFGTSIFNSELTPEKLVWQGIGLLITLATTIYTTYFARKALSPNASSQKANL